MNRDEMRRIAQDEERAMSMMSGNLIVQANINFSYQPSVER